MLRAAHRFVRREPWTLPLTLFALVFVLLTVLQSVPYFADPDSFYHLGMAEQIRDHGIVRAFRWLPFTVLAHDYADQHLLYHVALIPFVTWADPIIGMKLATSFFGALFAVVFYTLLARLRVPGAFAFTAALFLTNPFLFRMALAKAPSVSLLLLFLGLLFLFERRPWPLALLAFLYVWTYGGFPVLLVATVLFTAISVLLPRARAGGWNFLRRLADRLRHAAHGGPRFPNARLIAAAFGGAALGLVVNPFFPAIFRFERYQLLEIGILNYRSVIGVGGEWYPYPPRDLLLSSVFVSVAVVVGIVLFLANRKRMGVQSWTALALYLFFLALTLKSKRYVEYYVPFGFLFSALALRDTLAAVDVGQILRRLRLAVSKSTWRSMGAWALGIYVATAAGFVAVRDTQGVARDLKGGLSTHQFASSARYMASHSQPGDVVFHDDWDVFPALFYFDRVNAYIAGLDTTFLYRADPARYLEWANVTLGTYAGDPYRAVYEVYGAKWVHIGKDHTAMRRLIDGRSGFQLVYEDAEAWVYRVEPRSP